MRVTVVPCLEDNYAYVISDPRSGAAVVVDPSEAAPVRAAVESLGVDLVGVLATHHHFDHVGGIEALVAWRPTLAVWASEHDRGRVPCQTGGVSHGDSIALGDMRFRSLMVPGHTLGAVTWVADEHAFTGDTLFLAGCGRLFEGDPATMVSSLYEVLGALPDGTQIYPGHEYTEKNLRFALSLTPDDPAVAARLDAVRAVRAKGDPTVPATLREERRTNPFLRCDDPALQGALGAGDRLTAFTEARSRRNGF